MNREVLMKIKEDFDLERIKSLPVSEKFVLVEYIKLIYLESIKAKKEGIYSLEQSENYTVDKTYNMFANLVVRGTDFKLLKEIIVNYAFNFEDSDIYYSKIVMLGIGTMMIDKKFLPEAILNYLLSLLGQGFLTNNLHSYGLDKIMHGELRLDREVKYKTFETAYRKIKYDLLAMLDLRREKGVEYVSDIINNCYGNDRLRFYFNLLNFEDEDTRRMIYKAFRAEANHGDKLLLTGSYAILKNTPLFIAHYLFNSVLGKYSRYDKEMKEVLHEMNIRKEELCGKVGA